MEKKAISLKVSMDGEDSTGRISDGQHTFDELYEHRIVLYITMLRCMSGARQLAWRSKLHSDGTGYAAGEQITYHIPLEYWDETDFAETLDKAPEWDGHTSADVLERLKSL